MPDHIENGDIVRLDDHHILIGDTVAFSVRDDDISYRAKVYIGTTDRDDDPALVSLYGTGAGRCLCFWSRGEDDGGPTMMVVPEQDVTFMRRIGQKKSSSCWSDIDRSKVIDDQINNISHLIYPSFTQSVLTPVGDLP